MTPSWEIQNNTLCKALQFENFIQAVEFINKLVPIAEKAQHHPDIELFSYRNLRIKLSTHDAWNTVTEKDYSLAKEIDQIS